jgi:probable rRNA maturation factor
MLLVGVTNAHHRYRIPKGPVLGYVRQVLRAERKQRASVSVVFVGSRYCRTLNKKYLGHDFVTDVLSFTIEPAKNLEGEIYVNVDKARQQAREYGVSVANELARLVIHGTLHLLGYDDRTMRGAKHMRKQEERHLRYWFRGRREER